MKIAHLIFCAATISAIPLNTNLENRGNGTHEPDKLQELIDELGGVLSKLRPVAIPNIIGSQFFPQSVEDVEKYSGRGQIKTAIYDGIKKFFGGKIDKAKAFFEKLSPKAYKDFLTRLSGPLSRSAVGKSFTGVLVTTSQLQATWAQSFMAGFKLRGMNGDPVGHFMYHGMLYRGKWFQRILDRPDNAPGGIEAYRRGAKWNRPVTREALAQRAWKEDHDNWIGIDGRNFHQIEYTRAGGHDTKEMQDRHNEANKAAQQFVDDRCKGMPRDEAFKKYWATFHKIYDAHVTLAPGEYWRDFDKITPVKNKLTTGKYCGQVDPAMHFPLGHSRTLFDPTRSDSEPEQAYLEVESKGSSRCEWYWGPLRIFTCDALRN